MKLTTDLLVVGWRRIKFVALKERLHSAPSKRVSHLMRCITGIAALVALM